MKRSILPSGTSSKKNNGSQGLDPSHIAWHPAFIEALKLELEDFIEDLEFCPEYQLSSEPLRIDCVIIKKIKDKVISKNIAAIFRGVNFLEYKSPDDYISIADFYKVYGYACLYTSLEKSSITDATISFIESHYPRDLLAHLKETRGYTVEVTGSGIYTIKGDILPIQIIDSRMLSRDENLWLKDLDNRLGVEEIQWVTSEIFKLGKASRIKAYLDAITKANRDSVQEALKMSETTLTLDQIFEEAGLVAKWEARAEERKAIEVAKNFLVLGIPADTVASATGLEIEKVHALLQEKTR